MAVGDEEKEGCMFRQLDEPENPIHCEKGRIYFTRRLERKIFFVLTLFMLGAGILYKLGLL